MPIVGVRRRFPAVDGDARVRAEQIDPAESIDRRLDQSLDVLLARQGVEDPLAAHLGRDARGDLVDAELHAAHAAEVAAQSFGDRRRAVVRVCLS